MTRHVSATTSAAVSAADAAFFDVFGFVVVKDAVDAAALRAEIDDVVAGGAADDGGDAGVDTGVARVVYAPLMTRRTPVSLALVDALAPLAEALLGGPVLPVRAKGMRYRGDTTWHRDADGALSSLGCAAYLDVLTPETGALRLLPGSHSGGYADDVALLLEGRPRLAAGALPGTCPALLPGDLLVFDEHLFHASAGGGTRLQWRVDYVRRDDDGGDDAGVRALFGQIFDPAFDGGYDVDRAPSYDAAFRAGSPFAPALRALGVFDLADAHEDAMRARAALRRG